MGEATTSKITAFPLPVGCICMYSQSRMHASMQIRMLAWTQAWPLSPPSKLKGVLFSCFKQWFKIEEGQQTHWSNIQPSSVKSRIQCLSSYFHLTFTAAAIHAAALHFRSPQYSLRGMPWLAQATQPMVMLSRGILGTMIPKRSFSKLWLAQSLSQISMVKFGCRIQNCVKAVWTGEP